MKKEISNEKKEIIGKDIVFLVHEFSDITESLLNKMNTEEIQYFVDTMKDAFIKVKNWKSSEWIEDLVKECEEKNWGLDEKK